MWPVVCSVWDVIVYRWIPINVICSVWDVIVYLWIPINVILLLESYEIDDGSSGSSAGLERVHAWLSTEVYQMTRLWL